jgi:hypothetical protein
MDDTLLIGASAKMIKEDLGGGVSGRTTSVDFGVIGLPLWSDPRVALGCVLENMGGELTGFRLPFTARIGASLRRTGLLVSREEEGKGEMSEFAEGAGRAYVRYPWEFAGGIEDSLTLAADVMLPERGHAELHGGIEYWLSVVALRAGYRYRLPANELGGMSGLTLGLGLRGRGFRFDYGFDFSYAPYGELGNASRFSVSLSF